VDRSNAYSPEDRRSGAPVEYVFTLGDKAFALEHTVIEAFGGQLWADIAFADFVAPIVEALDHHLAPPGSFHAFFAIHPTKEITSKDVSKTQSAIIAWIRANAATLHNECPEQPSKAQRPYGYTNARKETIHGVDILLQRRTGWWMPDKAKARLLVARFAPSNHEELRRERLKEAMNKKLPKLSHWKSNGARSILILENRDVALSNHMNIFEAAEQALMGRTDGPDEIWLVDVAIEEEWTVWCLLRDAIPFPDEDTSTRYYEFRPGDLTDV